MTITQLQLENLASQVGERLLQRNAMLVTAESCTGGWVAQVITSISGSSKWFERGFVTYSNAAKAELLEVSQAALEQYGAVSEPVVKAMAEGALKHSQAQFSLAITGIAGPDGGTPEKPVGLVWFAWAGNSFATTTAQQFFTGDRATVRAASVNFSLNKLLQFI